ncbi:MAG: glycoside hydrolase family 2, partial [Chloroflexi bacterium]|nr:glycoside hydrolase family 2 [Chloroflexota bacterium]
STLSFTFNGTNSCYQTSGPTISNFFRGINFNHFGLILCAEETDSSRQAAAARLAAEKLLDLRGAWRFKLDPKDEGLASGWTTDALPERIHLPTTTDLAGFGAPEPDPNPGFLSREHKYIGAAWYQRELEIPEAWRGREVELFLERVFWESRAWVDGRECGAQDSLGTPHIHPLGRLSPGQHTLTLRIDNRMIHPIGDRGHCYTDFTQTIWNGAVGRIGLRARETVSLGLVRVFPNAAESKVEAEVTLRNATGAACSAAVQLLLCERGETRALAGQSFPRQLAPGANTLRFALELGFTPRTWDEFSPRLYELEVRVGSGREAEAVTQTFGFRMLTREGNRLLVNGRPTFLRGNLDCAQYPRTGHPPMDVESWRKVFRVCQDHGLNHVRFHSWCPPEAAFVAADEMGLYLLAEVLWIDGWMGGPNPRQDMDTPGYPKGVGRGDRTIDAYVRAETRRMLDAYGNHPSFCFFAIGNELGSSDFQVMGEWMRQEKERDPRRFYAASTARAITPADDFSDTHHIPGVGGVVNNLGVPHTDWDYEESYRRAPVPIIAHEMGQMPVYPDWREIEKYTGPLRARNFELFRAMSRTSGIAEQSADFQAASGAMNRLIYKNEMEAQLRSPGCAGVSWLSMQDFPGQGEALVGWRDVFYDSKGFVAPEQFRRYSAPTVPLARFKKFVWTTDETFAATAQVAHWGAQPLRDVHATWILRDTKGEEVGRGDFASTDMPVGGGATLGSIRVELGRVAAPQKLNLEIALPGTKFANDWNLWVFPSAAPESVPTGVILTDQPAEAWEALARGGRVVLLAHRLGDGSNARLAAWMPLFWSARFFPGQDRETLGALVQARHPALARFPTDRHLDWQWREICEGAHGFVLDDQPADYRPIVQPVSDYHFNHKLGSMFEFAAGEGGRLLVCGYDLANRLAQRPAARQLRGSLLAYAGSDAFAPKTTISKTRFAELFPGPQP